MKLKPIALAAISGLVIALAGMPVMADDNTTGPTMQSGSSSSDNSQATDNSQGQTNNSMAPTSGDAATSPSSSNNSDDGSPDTPSGDDF